MKKYSFINIALVALAMLASCQKEQITEYLITTDGVTEFTATIQQTKTAIASDGKVTWAVGDEITVTDADSKSAVYVAQNAGASTKFTLKDGETAVVNGPFSATYGGGGILIIRSMMRQVQTALSLHLRHIPLTSPSAVRMLF